MDSIYFVNCMSFDRPTFQVLVSSFQIYLHKTSCNQEDPRFMCLFEWSISLLSGQIAGYVNQPMVDVSILQRSLAILESMVLNSHSLYHRVAQDITVGQLIGHLQV